MCFGNGSCVVARCLVIRGRHARSALFQWPRTAADSTGQGFVTGSKANDTDDKHDSRGQVRKYNCPGVPLITNTLQRKKSSQVRRRRSPEVELQWCGIS